MSERWCKRCQRTLPLEAFNRHKDGYQWWCRECFKAYFRERGKLHLEQVAASRTARRERAHDVVIEHLLENSCVDCGESDIVVLEFDHIDLKTTEVAALVAASSRPEVVKAEIAKCEVVCCNCHRRRTYERRGTARTPDCAGRVKGPAVRRNLEWIYAFLRESRCRDCGLSDPVVLEFDHISEKRKNVMTMAWDAFGLDTIRLEVEQCDVRCANCHRKRTCAERNTYRYRNQTRAVVPAKLDSDPPL